MDSLKEAVNPVALKILQLESVFKMELDGLGNLLLAHFGVNDSKQELLVLGTLRGWQVSGQEFFESVGHFVVGNGSHVFQGLLSSCEGLVGSQLDHFAESFDIHQSLLNFVELTSSSIEFIFLKEAVTRGAFEK
jgi:hypothetical protein